MALWRSLLQHWSYPPTGPTHPQRLFALDPAPALSFHTFLACLSCLSSHNDKHTTTQVLRSAFLAWTARKRSDCMCATSPDAADACGCPCAEGTEEQGGARSPSATSGGDGSCGGCGSAGRSAGPVAESRDPEAAADPKQVRALLASMAPCL